MLCNEQRNRKLGSNHKTSPLRIVYRRDIIFYFIKVIDLCESYQIFINNIYERRFYKIDNITFHKNLLSWNG